MGYISPMLAVRDMKKTIDFYTNSLGFKVGMAFPSVENPQYADLSMDGMVLMFLGVNGLTRVDDQLLERLETMATHSKASKDRKKLSEQMAGALGAAAARSGRDSKMARQLARANLSLTVGEYLLFRLGIMLAGFAIGWLLMGMVLAGLGAALLASFLPGWYLNRIHKKRQLAFQGCYLQRQGHLDCLHELMIL